MKNNQEKIMHHLVFFIATITQIDRGAHYDAHSPETTMMKEYMYELKALLLQEGVITEQGMQRMVASLKKFGRHTKHRIATLTAAELEQEALRYDTRMQQYLAARGEQRCRCSA
jgi:hypothetical protein